MCTNMCTKQHNYDLEFNISGRITAISTTDEAIKGVLLFLSAWGQLLA